MKFYAEKNDVKLKCEIKNVKHTYFSRRHSVLCYHHRLYLFILSRYQQCHLMFFLLKYKFQSKSAVHKIVILNFKLNV